VVETFGAASHDEVLRLVVQVAVLLASARLLGALAQRLGQPGVVGEIMAGVVLGPSLLSSLVPAFGEWILPHTQVQGYLLEVVALIGVMLLLIVTGLETDLELIRRRIRVAFGVAVGGLVLPFATGLVLGLLIPVDLLADPESRTVFALFVATALSISAIPVLAKVLMDLGLMRREIGQTMLAAGMIDDITGWTLLGLVTALAGASALTAGTVVQTISMVLLFVVVTATAGRWLVTRSLTFVQERFRGRDPVLSLVIALAFAWGAFSQAIHLEPVIGAFAIGILFGRLRRMPADVIHKLEGMAFAVFAPVFFAVAGLKVNVGAILEPRLFGFTLLVIAVATIGKVVGAYAGARLLSGQDHWSALAYGSGLNARGALEIIIATIGLSLGILSVEMYSIIVVMAVVTSLMAPVALRFCLARIEPEAEELKRLAREDALGATFGARVRRILVPVRPRPDLVATRYLQALVANRLSAAHGTATTLLAVVPTAHDRNEATAYLRRLGELVPGPDTTTRTVTDGDPIGAILDEAAHGYDLLMVGTPSISNTDGAVFGPTIDDLVKLAPCPTLIVRADENVPAAPPRHILVPFDGTASSRRALELAFVIAGAESAVTAVHVMTPALSGARTDFAEDITAELVVSAMRLDQAVTPTIVEAADVESGISAALDATGADLLVMGTSVRAGTRRLYLGPRVERIAAGATCPVLILNA
jgi:Kef-type K+ transport system membrane component KefB